MRISQRRVVLSAVSVASLSLMLTGCPPEEETKEIKVLVSGSISLTGAQAEVSNKVIAGASAAIEWINENGGIKLPDNTVAKFELSYEDDESVAENVTTIVQAACDKEDVNFLLAPYSTGLTSAALEVATTCGKLLLDHGGASNSLFATGSDKIVASIAPASIYHSSILDAVKASETDVSSVNVAFLYEDDAFTKSVQTAAVAYATELGFDIGYNGNYPKSAADSSQFADIVTAITADPPDVILGGGHVEDGRMLINVLDQEGFAPKALSLLVAPTDPNFYDLTLGCPAPCDYANHPAEGVSGPSQWEVGVGFTEAIAKSNGRTWYGPEQDAFLDIYHKFAGEGQSPSYHAANGAVMMLSLALAIEKAQSLDTDKVRAAFDETDFTSFWGRWDVDETGANIGHAMVEVQWQQGVKQIVWPEDGKTASFTYPINN